TTHDTATTVANRPRRAICRRSIVAIVVAILGPLKDVPDHVVEAKSIRCERTDRRRLLVIPLATATVAVGIVPPDFVAPRKSRRRSSSRRIFVFGLGQQPIAFASHFGEPCHVLPRAPPADKDHRPLAASPTGVGRRFAISVGYAGVPLVECQ